MDIVESLCMFKIRLASSTFLALRKILPSAAAMTVSAQSKGMSNPNSRIAASNLPLLAV